MTTNQKLLAISRRKSHRQPQGRASGLDAAAAACAARRGDITADEIASSLCEAESDACAELTETFCAIDAEFIEKLRCLIKWETRLFGSPFESSAEFGSVARAAALHFGAGLPHDHP